MEVAATNHLPNRRVHAKGLGLFGATLLMRGVHARAPASVLVPEVAATALPPEETSGTVFKGAACYACLCPKADYARTGAG